VRKVRVSRTVTATVALTLLAAVPAVAAADAPPTPPTLNQSGATKPAAGAGGSGLRSYRWTGTGPPPSIPLGATSMPPGYVEVTTPPTAFTPTQPPKS
jgi:hypothetical protein